MKRPHFPAVGEMVRFDDFLPPPGWVIGAAWEIKPGAIRRSLVVAETKFDPNRDAWVRRYSGKVWTPTHWIARP